MFGVTGSLTRAVQAHRLDQTVSAWKINGQRLTRGCEKTIKRKAIPTAKMLADKVR